METDNVPKQAVILAAGESSRFWPLNFKHKSLFYIMGKPLIWYAISGLKQRGIEEVIVIQGPKKEVEEELRQFAGDLPNLKFLVQNEPSGAGDALLLAKDLLKSRFFLLNADRVDCEEIVQKMVFESRNSQAKMVLAGQKTENPWLYGIARLQGNRVLDIAEKPAGGQEPSNFRVVGIYLLDEKIFEYFGKTERLNDFEETLSLYMQDNDARMVFLDEGRRELSLKYPWQLFEIRDYLFDKFLKKPDISSSAQIAGSAVVEGNVFIGENARIFDGAVIKGPCYIGDNAVVGNNSVVRDHCDLEDFVLLGALCEAARVIFQKDVHVHSGYFGDSILDSGCRVGAGTVTANVRLDRGEITAKVQKQAGGEKRIELAGTGLRSLGIIAGQNSKIGINVSLMPGRMIGKDCAVGPGAVLMENLADGETDF
jgi:bifunctional UDP-N-acetylglucosamine pyrophosphorylase/glucosamine-1-phosphate N-acetyltransferase